MSTTPYIPSRGQHEITAPQRLLAGGDIAEPGFARRPYWIYDRKDITVPPARIKEWDCYVLGNQRYGMVLTIGDCGYVGNINVHIDDYLAGKSMAKNVITLFPMGKWGLPSTTAQGDTYKRVGGVELGFYHKDGGRELRGIIPGFGPKKQTLFIDLQLTDLPEETVTMATPFGKPGHFYYNEKINCMKVSGRVTLGELVLSFDPSDTLATLDWGRGVWTYDNTWYWSSLNTYLPDGSVFGWNLGYGFGDTSAASENMLIHNGKTHKLDEVTFHIPQKGGKDDFMSPWKLTSSDGRLEMDFVPTYDYHNGLDAYVLAMSGHQVFGHFSGKAVLDDGTVIALDRRMGFAEKYHNKW